MDALDSSTPPTTANEQLESRVKIINRLKRLEGQVRGLQRMIDEERNCREVLTLLSSIRSALDATGDVIFERYLEQCHQEMQEGELDVASLISAVKLARG